MPRIHHVSALLLALVLAACAARESAVITPQPATPDEVHRAWLAALQSGDRAEALDLYDPQATLRAEQVQTWIADAQQAIDPEASRSPDHGPFEQVEILPATLRGQQAQAYSVWHYERLPGYPEWDTREIVCWRATFGRVDAAWKVVTWEWVGCPDAITP